MEVNQADIVLCKFYFSDTKTSKDRPVLVFKDNLPHEDFVGIPLSSKIEKLFEDEFVVNNEEFESGELPITSKIMIRKTFVVSKQAVVKKYGTLKKDSYLNYHNKFCQYFGCTNEQEL
jgi:mRNA interferase MazF